MLLRLISYLKTYQAITILLVSAIAIGLGGFVFTNISQVRQALAAEVLEQQQDIAALSEDYARLLSEVKLTTFDASSQQYQQLTRASQSAYKRLFTMRQTYSFSSLVGASQANALVNPILLDINHWLSVGLPGYPPESDIVLKVIQQRLEDGLEALHNVVTETNATATQLITEQTQNLEQFAKTMILFLLAFALLSLMIILLIIKQRNFQTVLAKQQKQHATDLWTENQQIRHQASHDALTDLVNRYEFERRLQRVLDTAHKESTEHALCYMDLDQFKKVNDACGHAAGDELLRQIAELFRNAVRHRDTLGRLGGDEFGVLLEHCSLDQAQRVANNLRQAVEDFRFGWDNKSFSIGVSIGLVSIDVDSESASALLQAADSACYTAKDAGRNRIHIYNKQHEDSLRRHGETQWVIELNVH